MERLQNFETNRVVKPILLVGFMACFSSCGFVTAPTQLLAAETASSVTVLVDRSIKATKQAAHYSTAQGKRGIEVGGTVLQNLSSVFSNAGKEETSGLVAQTEMESTTPNP